MSEEKFVMTKEEELAVCNMVSTGTKVKDAVAKVKANRGRNAPEGEGTEAGKKALSAKDKKEAIAKEIEALNGEVPAMSASVAKFEEALTAAKAASEGGGEKTAEELQAEADAAKEVAETKRAEAEAAKEKAEAENTEEAIAEFEKADAEAVEAETEAEAKQAEADAAKDGDDLM